VTEHTEASCDQEHIDIILSSRATTPDRTDYILGRSEKSPLPAMVEDARSLEAYGATAIVIPCNTAHYFIDEVRRSVSVPMPSIITETVLHIKKCGFKCAAILATEGTVSSSSYQREFDEHGLSYMLPDERGQALLMELIYGKVKRGIIPTPEELFAVTDPMFESGCDCAILGCTELSLIGKSIDDERFVDSLMVLANCSIKLMGRRTVGFPESFN
ncbi:MAG: amino acid racemase, partial [Clostridia bacterium]|nr:amino acid racemase [Clostridia bacterium]